MGIDGQDGSYLADFLLSRDYEVIGWMPENVPTSLQNIDHILNELVIEKGSLLDEGGLNELIEKYRPDEVYNLASPSSPSKSWEDLVYKMDVTALGVGRLLEAIRMKSPKTRFYQASSSELFGQPVEVPQNEDTPFHPRNPYGIAKLHGHWLTVNYRNKYDMFAVSGILYNHESPRRGLDFVTRKITNGAVKIKRGEKKELLLGNLESRRDWGYAGDFVRAMWLMLQQDEPTDYVIGTGETHTVREFCEIAFSCLDLDYRDYVKTVPEFYRPREEKPLVSDFSKARERLGWTPGCSFKELIEKMIEAENNHLAA
jgi:GDPmannose 4,6-dehydratase